MLGGGRREGVLFARLGSSAARMGAGMLPGCCARAPTRLDATEHTMGTCLDGVDDARLTAVGARRAQAAAIAPQAALLPAAADGSRPLAHEFNCSMRVCCMAQRRCPSGGCRRASRQSEPELYHPVAVFLKKY